MSKMYSIDKWNDDWREEFKKYNEDVFINI